MLIELILLFFLMIAQVIIPPIPAEIIVIAAASKYGIFLTTLFAGSGLFAGSLIVYFFGSYIEKLNFNVFKSKQVKPILKKLKKHGNLLLLVRILPYNPSDIISYCAGLLKFNLKNYIVITFIVTFLRVFILALLGSYIVGLESLLGVIGLLCLSAIIAGIIVSGKKK